MSAIFGIVRFDGAPVPPREIERMGNMLAHRGPDGRRTMVGGNMAMGHCLLRVNTEDFLEAQPIQDGDLTLVADLRLDNREALAAAIGITESALCDLPDSAVLLAAYRHWGADCVDYLLGDFAFAIWDARAHSLLLGRDPMGQRGVYYHHNGSFFAFASEIKALWAVEGVPRQLSEVGIGRRLLFPIDPPLGTTLYESIALLPGGTLLQLDDAGALSLRSYWVPGAGAEHVGHDESYYLDAYRRVIEEAVACRVRRLIRAPALLFSGGFDSGSIAALAGPIVAAQGRRIVAVSSVLAEGEQRAVNDARAAAEAFRHYPFIDLHYYVRGEESIFSDIEASFAATDDSAGTAYVRRGLYRIAAESRARLVLDGHGGDYTVNVNARAMLGRILRRGHFRRFVREFRARMRTTGRTALQLWRYEVVPALAPLRALAAVESLRRGIKPIWQTRPVNDAFARSMFDRGAIDASRLRQPMPVHNRWRERWLHLLRKVVAQPPAQATLAAAHGLELSRPFHDKRVVELGLAIPESLQFKEGLERYLARHAFADILPARLLARGPGNDAEEPDLFRMANESASAALAEARALDRDGRLSRYMDFDRLGEMIAGADESRMADHRRLHVATRVIALARFIAWFERNNL